MARFDPLFGQGWTTQWLERTHKGLYFETVSTVYILSTISLIFGISSLISSHRVRKALIKNPSDRTAIFAKADKYMLRVNKANSAIALIYLFHAFLIWVVDAGIGVFSIYEDASSNPQDYSPAFWLSLAIHSIGMLAIFTAVFLLFPMAQMLFVGWLIGRNQSRNTEGTLAAYVPAARILSTHLAQLWAMLAFFIVAWWPVFEHTTARLIILEAVFGSTTAWVHASYVLNFRSEQLSEVEVQPLLGVRDGVKLYGQQVYAVHVSNGAASELPTYEPVAQSEQFTDEKSG